MAHRWIRALKTAQPEEVMGQRIAEPRPTLWAVVWAMVYLVLPVMVLGMCVDGLVQLDHRPHWVAVRGIQHCTQVNGVRSRLLHVGHTNDRHRMHATLEGASTLAHSASLNQCTHAVVQRVVGRRRP